MGNVLPAIRGFVSRTGLEFGVGNAKPSLLQFWGPKSWALAVLKNPKIWDEGRWDEGSLM